MSGVVQLLLFTSTADALQRQHFSKVTVFAEEKICSVEYLESVCLASGRLSGEESC